MKPQLLLRFFFACTFHSFSTFFNACGLAGKTGFALSAEREMSHDRSRKKPLPIGTNLPLASLGLEIAWDEIYDGMGLQ